MDDIEQHIEELKKQGHIDYCPYNCHRKKSKKLFCLKRYFPTIMNYCEVFDMTEEEREQFFIDGMVKINRYKGEKDA